MTVRSLSSFLLLHALTSSPLYFGTYSDVAKLFLDFMSKHFPLLVSAAPLSYFSSRRKPTGHLTEPKSMKMNERNGNRPSDHVQVLGFCDSPPVYPMLSIFLIFDHEHDHDPQVGNGRAAMEGLDFFYLPEPA